MKVDIEEILKRVEQGYICARHHPEFPLTIYNYTNSCTFGNAWDSYTCMCRGLIVDDDNNIIGRPFEKFFNYEELPEYADIIPNLPFEVFDKLDGSLGIIYFWNDKPYIATRGSFDSEMAIHATELLYNRYKDCFDKLDRSKTYLFEIIYPENRIVINYGDTDDIFLLAVVDTETGEENDIYEYKDVFNCVHKYDGVKDFRKVREMFSGDNKEGFVIKFANNFRIKMKFAEYFKLHFLMSQMSSRRVLEYIMNGSEEFKELISKLDEENKIYWNKVYDDYFKQFADIENECKEYLNSIIFMQDTGIINNIKIHRYSAVLFRMWRNQDYQQTIWNYIKKLN